MLPTLPALGRAFTTLHSLLSTMQNIANACISAAQQFHRARAQVSLLGIIAMPLDMQHGQKPTSADRACDKHFLAMR